MHDSKFSKHFFNSNETSHSAVSMKRRGLNFKLQEVSREIFKIF